MVAHPVRYLVCFLVLLLGSLHLACDEKTNNNSWLAALPFLLTSTPDTRLLRIYVTTATYNPLSTIGGVSGADSKCNTDAGKPSSGTYKALLAAGTTRRACSTGNCSGGSSENIDWPLKASRAYYRTNQTTEIGTTTAAGIFEFPLKASFAASGTDAWSGLPTGRHLRPHAASGRPEPARAVVPLSPPPRPPGSATAAVPAVVARAG